VLIARYTTWRKSRRAAQDKADRATFWAQVEEQALSMSRHPAGKGRAVPFRAATSTPLFDATVQTWGFRPRRPSVIWTATDDADLMALVDATREDGAR
jgi:hypothetical protein